VAGSQIGFVVFCVKSQKKSEGVQERVKIHKSENLDTCSRFYQIRIPVIYEDFLDPDPTKPFDH